MLPEKSKAGSSLTSRSTSSSMTMSPYRPSPPLYSDAISRDSSWKTTCHSSAGGMIGGSSTCVSMKFNRRPRLHSRFDFRQFTHMGSPSSHLRCLCLQVRHPVRTLFGLDTAVVSSANIGMPPCWPPSAIEPPPTSNLTAPRLLAILFCALIFLSGLSGTSADRLTSMGFWRWSPNKVASETVEEEYGDGFDE